MRGISIVLAAGLALAATAASADTRSFGTGSFDRVESAGPFDVTILTGKAASVRAEGAAADLDKLRIDTAGGKLRIGTKDRGWFGNGWHFGKVLVTVTVPALNGVSLAGSGDVRVDRARATAFKADLAGSGDLRIDNLDTADAKFSLAGSGDILATGRCGSAEASIAGSGNIRIGGLACRTLDANIAGSGSIMAHASQTANASIMGSGDVIVTGGAKCTSSKMGSGSVRCN